MSFVVRVWCDDCSGDNDADGCFGGGTETRGKDADDTPFDTREEAETFGVQMTIGAPWSFEVVEVDVKEGAVAK